MEKLEEMLIMLSISTLSVFQIEFDHVLHFIILSKQFTTDGSVQPQKKSRRRTVTGENNEIAVLAAVANNLHVSTREIARDSGMSQNSVLKILKYYPYQVSLHQDLHGVDLQNRVAFCQWARQLATN